MIGSDTYTTEVFDYLDALRASGETNMFGAAPYLQDEFDMTRKEARDHLTGWMRTYNGDVPSRQRASDWLASLDPGPDH